MNLDLELHYNVTLEWDAYILIREVKAEVNNT